MTFKKQTIRDVPLDNKVVLVRADYNVPLDENGQIADDFRIRSSVATLEALLARGCKVVVIAHLGRPKGRDSFCSLELIAERLRELIDAPVLFISDCIGDKVRSGVKNASMGSVVLLENLRFYDEEEANDLTFATKIAKDSGARYFVQDGFGVVHRAHASTSAITQCLPSVAGLLLEKEYLTITSTMKHPARPLVAVLGGAKVSDKIEVIEALESVADQILIGGAMANTFLEARGASVGKSKCESDQGDVVKRIYARATKKVGEDMVDEFLVLPSDVAVAKNTDATSRRRTVLVDAIGADDRALDIGDITIERYVQAISHAKTVLWNGTLGYAELPQFAHGSARIALALATHPDIVSVIGGGDTADFVLHWDSQDGTSFTHVSTGGGASLELMAGKKLPGVESLLDAQK